MPYVLHAECAGERAHGEGRTDDQHRGDRVQPGYQRQTGDGDQEPRVSWMLGPAVVGIASPDLVGLRPFTRSRIRDVCPRIRSIQARPRGFWCFGEGIRNTSSRQPEEPQHSIVYPLNELRTGWLDHIRGLSEICRNANFDRLARALTRRSRPGIRLDPPITGR